MNELTKSRARLRTKTGCFSCKERRKKCDEVKPKCTRCLRSTVDCVWPTAHDVAQDRRHQRSTLQVLKKSQARVDSEEQPFADLWSLSSIPEEGTENGASDGISHVDSGGLVIHPVQVIRFDMAAESILLSYYANQLLPSLIHSNSHSRYKDFSYWCSMALVHQPLMDSALACAAMSMSHKMSADSNWMARMRRKALIHQTSSISAMREAIEFGKVDGTEDWLLATVVGLTLFDNRDVNLSPPSSSAHVMALTKLFKCRQTSKLSAEFITKEIFSNGTSSTVFERICYESLLFNGTVLMLYDRDFDALIGNSQMMDSYFQTSPLPDGPIQENWPILGMSYKLFQLIMVISRFGRRCPLNLEDLDAALAVLNELTQWSDVVYNTETPSASALYVLAAKTLLQEILAKQIGSEDLRNCVDADIHRTIQLIKSTTIGPQFSRYYLWPLSVIGHVTRDPGDKILIENSMALALQKTDGQGELSATPERIKLFLEVSGLSVFDNDTCSDQ